MSDGRTIRSSTRCTSRNSTAAHPVPKELRESYAGMACPAARDHLHSLGITAVELMPVEHVLCKTSISWIED